jgi:hypothetical protein
LKSEGYPSELHGLIGSPKFEHIFGVYVDENLHVSNLKETGIERGFHVHGILMVLSEVIGCF